MNSFFKKALGTFVEFEDDQNKDASSASQQFPPLYSGVAFTPQDVSRSQSQPVAYNNASGAEQAADAEKFERYFDKLFDQANLPGPDYFEFYKMMETLEAHIKDENARISATFAALSIQGLTKQKLVESASIYKGIIEKDKASFEVALQEKLKSDVIDRRNKLTELQNKITANSEQIQKLTKEITEAQIVMEKLKSEIVEEENKLSKNSKGYQRASHAIISQISTDIQKIQSTL